MKNILILLLFSFLFVNPVFSAQSSEKPYTKKEIKKLEERSNELSGYIRENEKEIETKEKENHSYAKEIKEIQDMVDALNKLFTNKTKK